MSQVLEHTNTRHSEWYWPLFGFIAFVQILPNWIVKYVPLVDFPSHLARAFVSTRLATNPYFAQRFEFVLRPHPNSALDLFLPALIWFFPPLIAAKVLLTLTVLLFMWGCDRLSRAVHGTDHYPTLIACFIAMNWMYLYGFINYVFAIGVYLVSFSCWIRWRGEWTLLRAVSILALLFVCFLSHLSAAAFLVVTVITYELALQQRIRVSRVIAVALIALAVFSLALAILLPKALSGYYWGTLLSKSMGMLTPIRSYDLWLDGVVVVVFCVAGLLLRRSIWFNKPLLAAAIVLIGLYLITPAAYFSLGGADVRAIPVVAVLLLISAKVEKSLFTKGVFIVMLAAFTLRLGVISVRWLQFEPGIQAQVDLLDKVPSGATLYPVVYEDQMLKNKEERTLSHVVSYATIRNEVVPGDMWYNLLRERIEKPKLKFDSRMTPRDGELDTLTSFNDYLWCYKLSDAFVDSLRTRADSIDSRNGAILFHARR